MELQVKSLAGKNVSQVNLSDSTFAIDFNEGLVHQSVTTYLATARAGTKAQKTRSDVSGGGAKPWRQKGTGRARAGTTRSPLWRKGGVTFAARPRDFSKKLNKKMLKKAMQSILSELLRQERILVLDEIKLPQPKTKELLKALGELAEIKTLIVLAEEDKNVILAARNLYTLRVITQDKLDAYSLVAADKVIFTLPAIKKVEERLA